MVLRKRRYFHLVGRSAVGVKNCSRIADVAAKNCVAVKYQNDTGGSAEFGVEFKFGHLSVGVYEYFVDDGRHSVVELGVVPRSVVWVLFDQLLEQARHVFFDELRCQMAVDAVPVADSEEVESKVAHHVRNKDVRVLVLLIRVAWLVADAGGKRKLGDAIELFIGLNWRERRHRLHYLRLRFVLFG